jgi:phage shock protein A
MFWTYVLIAGVVIFGLYILNKTAARRMKDAIGAQVGKAGRALWSMDPVAVKNAEIDRKAEEIADATKGLENCRALIAGVERQVVSGKKEQARLQALSEQYARENNDALALEKLTELERVTADVDANEAQLKVHKETYEAFLTKIKHAHKSIARLRKEAKEQGVRLQMSKAEANLAKLGNIMGKHNLSFDSMSEVDEEIESQIDKNRAAGQVAHDLAKEGLEEIAAEERARNAKASDKLAALKQKLNGGGVAVHPENH